MKVVVNKQIGPEFPNSVLELNQDCVAVASILRVK